MIADFQLDLARAITEQLVEQFNSITSSPLTVAALKVAKSEPGVYQLFLDNTLVYVGKSDKDLRNRLDRHRRSLMARKNINVAQVSFKGMRLDKNWSTLTTEAQLIKHFGDAPWNNSGFGSNDPGRNRDQTDLKEDHFDAQYPIDVNFVVEIPQGETTADQLLLDLKRQLPYLLRYEKLSEKISIDITKSTMSTRELLVFVASHLKGDWQATALPGRILLYPETNKTYPNAEILWPNEK